MGLCECLTEGARYESGEWCQTPFSDSNHDLARLSRRPEALSALHWCDRARLASEEGKPELTTAPWS